MGLVGFRVPPGVESSTVAWGPTVDWHQGAWQTERKCSTAIQYERGYGERPGQLGIIDEIS